MPGNNYYDILEISPDASAEVIRAAYRSLSKKYHPDSNPDAEGVKRFKLIQEAWEVLSDPEKRRQYDEQLGRAGRASGNRERKGQGSAESATGQLPPDLTVMKVDGTSSFLTLSEHFKRKWKEAAGCDLGGMKFDGVSFRGAILTGAKLDGSSFVGCDFSDADLTDCSARNCDFHRVRFSGAELVRTAFSGSNLQKTLYFQVHASEGSTCRDESRRYSKGFDSTIHLIDSSVRTRRTLLQSTDFSGCDLLGAAFCAPATRITETITTTKTLGVERHVPLYVRQSFSNCPVKESRFAKCNLHELDLHGFDLKGCDFSGAHLQGVNLEGADIQGLDLSTCNLVNANLHKVKYDRGTQFPDGYPIPSDAVDMAVEREKERELATEQAKKRQREQAEEWNEREKERERERKRQRELAEKGSTRRAIFTISIMVAVVGAVVAITVVREGEKKVNKSNTVAVPSMPLGRPRYDDKREVNKSNTVATPHVTENSITNGIGMEFRLIPAGTFRMGSTYRDPDEVPVHEVTLTQPFYIGVYEVTQEQYKRVMGTNPSHFKGGRYPVESVSWDDAVGFCRKLSSMPQEKSSGLEYRLPTEAEWEYACRAGTTTAYSFGDRQSQLGEYGWFNTNSNNTTHAVGKKRPNGWGLYDMHGNVWEWCADWYGTYPEGSATNPTGPASGWARVYRGGSWFNIARDCRSANRFFNRPDYRSSRPGFRVVLIPPDAGGQ